MRDSQRYLLEEVRLGSQGRVILGQVGRVASGGLLEPGKVWDETPGRVKVVLQQLRVVGSVLGDGILLVASLHRC